MRIPSADMTIDETLYPYRGHIGIKTYNPNKPARYGLLIFSLCDATVPYTYYSLPYAGQPENPNMYYVHDTDEKSIYLVNNLSKYCDLPGRNISLDRYFTNISLANWLVEKKISLVGTMQHSRVGIPPELKETTEVKLRRSYTIVTTTPTK